MNNPLKGVDKGEESKDNEVHMEMMKTVLKEFTKERATNVRANFDDMTVPEKIDEFTPDLTFNSSGKNRKFVILEVETCHTITQPQSERKWRIFQEKAKETAGEFHLAVPKFCSGNSGRTLANQKLEEYQIKSDYVWVVNGCLQLFAMHIGTNGR